MSLIHSRFGLADMEALLWDPSSPMADPLGSYLHKDDEVVPPGGAESPLSSFSSSPHSPLSPPCAFPPSQSVEKAGLDHLSLPWLPSDELCLANNGTDGGKESAFCEMDWMTERIDLSEFDLDSLIGSYESEDPPSSPEELLATLESQLDLEHLPQASDSTTTPLSSHPAPPPEPIVSSVPMVTEYSPSTDPETQDEMEIKLEPASPVPSVSILPPESPTDTLELGCEVDVPEVQSPSPVELQVPKIVLSLSPTRIVVLLAPKREIPASVRTTKVLLTQSPPSPVSSPPRSTTVKPYTPLDSKSDKNPLSKPLTLAGRIKSDGGTKVVVEKKKLKKMEQNKTAATRYRQKKRAEQDALLSECVALEERNQELFDKAESITKEIQYLKDLMEEVKRAREGRSVKS